MSERGPTGNNELLSHLLERERAMNLYLFAKLDHRSRRFSESSSENSGPNAPRLDFKSHSTDFSNLDSFILRHELLQAQNRGKLLLQLEDGLSGISPLKNSLLKSQLSDEALANVGPLFLYFDDIQVQNQQLHQKAAELEFEISKQRGRESAALTDDCSIDSMDTESTDDVEEELHSIEVSRNALTTQKEALEAELQHLMANAPESATAGRRGELDELQCEIVRLRAKISGLTIENRRLSARVPSPRNRSSNKSLD
jgi:chaperonin cofactor prefoldin